MPRLTRIQPAARPDAISADGHVGYQLPYPFYVADDGKIQNQELWNGTPLAVIGFQKDLAVQTIDVWWREVVDNPEKAVGLYLVTTDKDGTWGVHSTAVESAYNFNEGDSPSG